MSVMAFFFSLFFRLQGFWENVRPFISRLRFFCLFFKWRLVRAHLFHSLGKDQSTLAQRTEPTVAECTLRSCVRARFLIRSRNIPGQHHNQPHSDSVGPRVYACLGLTCHLHFWQNDRGLLRATAVTRRWNGHRIRVSTQS